MPAPAPVRVIVKLPYNRPENAPSDPPKIEWTPEKADILWKVIEIQRARSVDSAGADWKGLAAHLEVPLPYLLYRVNARFQEEIRGLKDIQGALSPSSAQPPKGYFPAGEKPQSVATRMVGSDQMSSSRLVSPLGVRARLSSLGNAPRPKKATSSSTLTLQPARKTFAPLRPTSPSSSVDDGTDSSDEQALKEEEAERNAEEDEALERKLAQLQKMMTNDALGLVSGTRSTAQAKAKDRGRSAPLSPRSIGSSRQGTLSSRSASQSVSGASSPQGSIPEIPSPSSGSQPRSPMGWNMPAQTAGPGPATRNLVGQGPRPRDRPLVDRAGDLSSGQGSEASSFSDLSDASLSASALESALMSNINNQGSHFSQFTRSRGSARVHSTVPQ
ncbi:unnamed protein product [Cyclocybe aegerita]|uniref:Autophagy-related protein 29 n=1 Tax=Cyclocybe aegerita TaxID=1973307 RepID=A0A8S0WJ80_CYCAE|nr:unnamed protein product [Cyclocybe aegerita]